MANPKRRQSKQRSRKRRTHQGASVEAPFVDSSTGAEHTSHKIDPKTGYYRGRQVLTVKQKNKS